MVISLWSTIMFFVGIYMICNGVTILIFTAIYPQNYHLNERKVINVIDDWMEYRVVSTSLWNWILSMIIELLLNYLVWILLRHTYHQTSVEYFPKPSWHLCDDMNVWLHSWEVITQKCNNWYGLNFHDQM